MSVLVVIPARYASTRFPGKPLALLQGKPVIQHVYERARRAKRAGEVVVATDDQRIVEAVERCGGLAVMTSAGSRSGTERVGEVARSRDAQVIINVQGDEPLIQPDMIDQLAEYLERHRAVPMASLMTKLARPEEVASPHIVKVVVDRDGFALYFSRAPIPHVRGAAPTCYKHLGIYGYQRHFLLRFPHLEPTPLEQAEQLEQLRALEHGHRIKLLETAHDTIGVDTPDDLKRVETMLRNARPRQAAGSRHPSAVSAQGGSASPARLAREPGRAGGSGRARALRVWAATVAVLALLASMERGIAEDTSWMELDAQAVALYQVGQYAQAAAITEEALRRAVRAFGPDDVNVAKYQHNLARLYVLQHKEAEAELLYQRSLSIVERAQGATHPQAASILEGYAALERAMGKVAQAESMEARLKKIRAADPARKQRWQRLTAQVEDLSGQGRYADAVGVAKETLKVAEEAFGANDPNLARSLSDVAELYRVTGQLAQAEPLHQRALAIREKALGPRHPHVAQSLTTLGHLYKAQGSYAKAKSVYERALAINEAAGGKDDFTVANDVNNLAELAVTQGNFGSAAALYKRLIEILEKTPDLASGELAMTLEKYALCLRKAGKTREAEKIEARAKALGGQGQPATP